MKITLGVCLLAPRPASAFLGFLFAPKSELWERWAWHSVGSPIQVAHTRWAGFLARNVDAHGDGINRIDYARISDSDITELNRYIGNLSDISVSLLAREEQLAFWINLYNALTVQLVHKHFPVTSIRDIDISPGLFADGPWGAKLIEIEGKQVSLNDIEHRIIRPIWQDPRAHYALNCAALGCPNLQAVPFRAATMNQQLDAAARDFINHPRGVSLKNGKLIAASIYNWFKEDFGGSDKTVLEHLTQFAEPALKKILAAHTKIDGYEYDWSLNGTP